MAFWRRKDDVPVDDTVGARMVIARLDSIADRQEAVYELLVRALRPVSPVDEGRKDDH